MAIIRTTFFIWQLNYLRCLKNDVVKMFILFEFGFEVFQRRRPTRRVEIQQQQPASEPWTWEGCHTRMHTYPDCALSFTLTLTRSHSLSKTNYPHEHSLCVSHLSRKHTYNICLSLNNTHISIYIHIYSLSFSFSLANMHTHTNTHTISCSHPHTHSWIPSLTSSRSLSV